MINEIIEKAVAKSVDEYIEKLLSEVVHVERGIYSHHADKETRLSLNNYIKKRVEDRLEQKIGIIFKDIEIDKLVNEKFKEFINNAKGASITLSRYEL